jgi:hypothetical protein
MRRMEPAAMTIPDAPPVPEIPRPNEPDIEYPDDEPPVEYPETDEPARQPVEPQERKD